MSLPSLNPLHYKSLTVFRKGVPSTITDHNEMRDVLKLMHRAANSMTCFNSKDDIVIFEKDLLSNAISDKGNKSKDSPSCEYIPTFNKKVLRDRCKCSECKSNNLPHPCIQRTLTCWKKIYTSNPETPMSINPTRDIVVTFEMLMEACKRRNFCLINVDVMRLLKDVNIHLNNPELLPVSVWSTRTKLGYKGEKDKPSLERDPLDYRPISRPDHYRKLLSTIVLILIGNLRNYLSPFQFAFKGARECTESTMENYFSIFQNLKKWPNILYIDIRKAFDTISRNHILKRLLDMGINSTLIYYIKYSWDNWTMNMSYILDKDRGIFSKSSPYFKPLNGIPQGDPLSPLLYCIAIDPILWELSKLESQLVVHMYIDDLQIMAVEIDTLSEAEKRVKTFLSSIGQEFNHKKSGILIPHGVEVEIKGELKKYPRVTEKEPYKYLGTLHDDKMRYYELELDKIAMHYAVTLDVVKKSIKKKEPTFANYYKL